jgi:uncharacterized protein
MRTLNKEQILNICYGATFLGCGGGGPFKTGKALVDPLKTRQGQSVLSEASKNLVQNFFSTRNFGDIEVTVKTVDEVNDNDGVTAVVAFIGSPNATLQLENVDSAIAAFELFDEQLKLEGKYIGQVIPVEIGALNSIVAILVAAQKGIPVIDADGAGRAVPSLTTTTFGAADLSANPTILAKSKTQGLSIFVETAAEAEAFVRPVLEFFDEQAGLAMWAMDKETLERAVPIRGTLQLAQDVGASFNPDRSKQSSKEFVADLAKTFSQHQLKASVLFEGIVQPVETKTQGGFDFSRVILRDETNREVWIYTQNENLIAWDPQTARPIITAPDSICYLYETSEGRLAPFSNADIQPLGIVGKRAMLVGIAAHPEWQTNLRLLNNFMKVLTDLGFRVPYQPFFGWQKAETVELPE